MLNEKHLADLHKSGLTGETIKKLGFFSATESELRELLKFECHGGGMVIPYPMFSDYYRAKSDNPIVLSDGKVKAKYLAKSGVPNHFYMLEEVQAIANDVSKVLIITEGEKKAAKACQEGFPTLGLGGVSSWWAKKKEGVAVPDFDLIQWVKRLVYLIFDSDFRRNKDVAKALNELKTYLETRGAIVIIKYLPDVEGYKSVGLDDFLILKGSDSLRGLLVLKDVMPDVERNFEVDKIVKIDSRPATWELHLLGKVVRLTAAELCSFESFKHKALDETNQIMEFDKPNIHWEDYVKAKLQNGSFKIEEPLHGSSDTDPIKVEIIKMLRGATEDIANFAKTDGVVLKKGNILHARGKDVVGRVLKVVKSAKPTVVGTVAKDMGADKDASVRVKPGQGGVIRAWGFPLSVLDTNVDSSKDDDIEKEIPNDF